MRHRTMLVVDNGRNHVECRCGYQAADEEIRKLVRDGRSHDRARFARRRYNVRRPNEGEQE